MFLKNKKILITRSEVQAAELRNLIIAEGGEPVDFPTIAIAPPDSFDLLDSALKRINSYEWVFFTSANGVNSVVNRAAETKIFLAKERFRVAAIGKGTAGALKKAGIEPDILPEDHSSEGLIKEFAKRGIKIESALIFTSDIGKETLRNSIIASGGIADSVVAYKTVKPAVRAEKIEEILSLKIDAIVFTSPSTFKNFREIVGERGDELIRNSTVVCIGKTTASAVSGAGFKVAGVPEEATPEGLLHFFRSQSLI